MQHSRDFILGQLENRITQIENQLTALKERDRRLATLAVLGLVALAANQGPDAAETLIELAKAVLL